MAKKEEPKLEPAVSNLPMPISENPLVIDLPDGQKLVVGKMDSGSVIEVATWRGTGRPDSRTSRLMLGMSTSQPDTPTPAAKNQVVPQDAKTETAADTKKEVKKFSLSIPKVGAIAFKVPQIKLGSLKKLNVKAIYSSLMSTRSKLVAKSKELAPVESVGELDIEQWLTNIKQEAEKKVVSAKTVAKPVGAPKQFKKSATAKKSVKKSVKKR
jgi:hypothetical protein